jgi:chorismate synthase
MAGNSFGRLFRITTFGESHGKAVGVVIDGVPSMIELDVCDVQYELDRRRPGQSAITTERAEEDRVEILSGVFEGKTTGTPIAMLVYNKDQRSNDYSNIKDLFRPGHADYTYFKKYGIRDYRGGGRASSRETIGRVCGGAVAKKILKKENIYIMGYVKQIGNIKAEKYDFDVIEKNPARCPDIEKSKEMVEYILSIKNKGDSIGGIVEIVIKGLPPGIGEPVFDRLNAEIAKAIMSIPAVKGIQFGVGFDCVAKLGSELHDEITDKGFLTNNAGGTLGGISTGQDVIFNFVVKPPSSILIPRRTIDIYGKETTAITKGRHDPCVAPRVVPVGEAMTAIVTLDLLMVNRARKNL